METLTSVETAPTTVASFEHLGHSFHIVQTSKDQTTLFTILDDTNTTHGVIRGYWQETQNGKIFQSASVRNTNHPVWDEENPNYVKGVMGTALGELVAQKAIPLWQSDTEILGRGRAMLENLHRLSQEEGSRFYHRIRVIPHGNPTHPSFYTITPYNNE